MVKHPKDIELCKILNIEFPIIVAPMFLVSNKEMIIEAVKSGVTGAIPALNYRTTEGLVTAIREIKKEVNGPFGINLIVNKSNFLYKEQLRVCCDEKVNFIITSLGSPKETIRLAHENGIKVFCDVTNLDYAMKVQKLGADAVIAVNKEAGGHAGNISYKDLLPELKSNCSIPVISAGAVGNGYEARDVINLGADGLSMGSVFIASNEAGVSEDYKEACVLYGASDIVLTTKISGTPCTVINTDYVKKVGLDQSRFQQFLNKHKRLKKWYKALTFYRGMKSLRKAAFEVTYKTVWCAGPSIEHVKAILPLSEIIANIRKEYEDE